MLFSEIQKQGCSFEDLLLEMDRILRPRGYVIFRDKASVINYIKTLLKALRWDDWLSEVIPKADSLSSDGEKEKVMIVRKKLWRASLDML